MRQMTLAELSLSKGLHVRLSRLTLFENTIHGWNWDTVTTPLLPNRVPAAANNPTRNLGSETIINAHDPD